MRRALGRVALLLVGLVVGLGLVELVLRVHNPFAPRLRAGAIVLPANRVEVWHNVGVPNVPAVVVKRRNGLGFRGPEPPRAFAEALTLVTVGGSTTEASYEPDGATWTDRLATSLARCFTDLWVNNAGLDGHTTFGHLVLLRDHLARLRPDVVVFLVGANDRWASMPSSWDLESGAGEARLSDATSLGKALAARLETADLVLTLYRGWRAWRHGAWWTPVDWGTVPEAEPAPPDGDASPGIRATSTSCRTSSDSACARSHRSRPASRARCDSAPRADPSHGHRE